MSNFGFLNNDAGIYTSARDRGDGNPITDVSDADVKAQLELVKAELQALKDKINEMVNMQLYCKSTDTKPTTGVKMGTTMLEVDTKDLYIFNGTTWEVF